MFVPSDNGIMTKCQFINESFIILRVGVIDTDFNNLQHII